MKLDLKYWSDKFDRLEDVDATAISDAFAAANYNDQGLNDYERDIIAEILLAGVKVFKDNKEYRKAFEACQKFNTKFAVNHLFCSYEAYVITVWRYDYRKLVKAIPEMRLRKAITTIYARLGYELEEDDILRIGAADNIYSVFLKTLKEEANGRYIVTDIHKDKESFPYQCYLNLYLLFDKLGLEGRSVFSALAYIGEVSKPVSEYQFMQCETTQLEMADEARDRSRGRLYPTIYEVTTVLDL